MMFNKTSFHVPKMDCAAEEQMIRMKLEENDGIHRLDFDLPNRKLVVIHGNEPSRIADELSMLNLGARLIETTFVETIEGDTELLQRKLLWTVLFINFGFFIIELTTGFVSKSMGLVADSLDMLADAFVYGLSLLAVGGTIVRKKRVAKVSGYFQLGLALLGFAEVIRRFLGYDIPPVFSTMIIVSILALIANSLCLWLLHRSKSAEAHIRASMIFTSNDVIINLGVIAAGILVHLTNSNKPDLVIGSIVFVIVSRGVLRILKLGK